MRTSCHGANCLGDNRAIGDELSFDQLTKCLSYKYTIMEISQEEVFLTGISISLNHRLAPKLPSSLGALAEVTKRTTLVKCNNYSEPVHPIL